MSNFFPCNYLLHKQVRNIDFYTFRKFWNGNIIFNNVLTLSRAQQSEIKYNCNCIPSYIVLCSNVLSRAVSIWLVWSDMATILLDKSDLSGPGRSVLRLLVNIGSSLANK